MFCSVLASAVRTLALCLFRLCFCVLVSHSQPGPGASPPCSRSTCTHAGPFTDTASLRRNAQAYELEGVKRVRNLKYLIEQLPYCAPSSSDSPSCAGHKLMSPEDVTGICFSFAHLLTARHWELRLPQKPDLLTLAQQLCCTPWVLGCQREGCSAHRGVCIHLGCWP